MNGSEREMSFRKALAWGIGLAVVATAGVLLVGFLGRMTISLPGFVEVSSSTEGAPQTELQFNPLAPLLLAVGLAVVIWLVGWLAGRRKT